MSKIVYLPHKPLSIMTKLSILLLIICLNQLVIAQKVQHYSYTTYYNAGKEEPDSVSWNLTPSMVNCNSITKRHNRFKADPLIAGCVTQRAYTHSGYDKGHLFSYEDAHCNATDQVECFYMSNMLPQLHSLNAGDWKTLETQERVWASTQRIHVIAGGLGSKGYLTSGVNIPESCWKAIYLNNKWHVYVMPNVATSVGHDYTYWEVKSIKRFDKLVGLNL
jgi:DNA/RNA endonuclease G (NUC1)